MTRVVVVTPEALGARLPGPAIRAWHMAEELAAGNDVRLVSTAAVDDVAPAPFPVIACPTDALIAPHCGWADVVVSHPGPVRTHGTVANGDHCLVGDVYDPFHLENLEPGAGDHLDARFATIDHLRAVINDTLIRSDVLLAASERQRDFWLGSLAALGRINPATYDRDASFDSLVRVVPFGLPVDPPQRASGGLRGIVPGIGADDKVVLWGGGVYNWFDPVTLVEAVDKARVAVPNLRLVFLGMAHPNPDVPQMHAAMEARARSAALGLTGIHVFFNEGWVPYSERASYLLDADVGVSTHQLHIETVFSYRTRILDYVWARLPYVTSDGDLFADLARAEGTGRAVPPRDVDALATALTELLTDRAAHLVCRENLDRVAARFTWPVALGPLVEYCHAPEPAADRDRMRGRPASSTAQAVQVVQAAQAGEAAEGLRTKLRRWRQGGS